MKRRKIGLVALCIIAGFLLLTSAAVVYADSLLGRIYQEQKNTLLTSAHATALPVLQATPAPSPTPAFTPEFTPIPPRMPLPGDILGVRFPNYDTGVDAAYSYQSDELRIAVNKVEEEGVTYYVADIWMRNINCFRTAFSSGKYRGKREDAEKIAQDNNAILAVNGDFLEGLVIRNGVLYRKADLRPTPTPTPVPVPEFEEDMDADSAPVVVPELDQDTAMDFIDPLDEISRPERATCVLYYDGRMVTEEYDTFRSTTAMKRGAFQGWQFGPTLVRGGKAAEDVKAQGRNPRCMLGYYEPGHYCIVLIDGRQKSYSIGMNFLEMMDLALRLGLTEAYNLDGGASAIMAFNGEIINQPSGSGDARSLSDMVIIGDYLAPEQRFQPTPGP